MRMASLLGSLGEMITPDTLASLGKALGTDSNAVSQALGAAGPLLLGSMSKMASTPAGAESLFNMAKEHGGGILGSLGSLFGGLFGGGAPAGPAGLLNSLLGSSTNAIGASLSKALGFNVTPLLSMAAPALLGAVSKMVSSQNMDASSLATTLKRESEAFAADPANKASLELVNAARANGEKADALIKSFGADWSKVAAGPAAALFMIATGDLSGPVGSIKEASAANDKLLELVKGAAPDSLMSAAFAGGITPEMVTHLKTLAPSKDKLIDVVKGSIAAVQARSPGEAAAYRSMIMNVADAAAKASKEGGFLGIGGTLVSEGEQKALDAIKAALG
jgi:hypothetical protein